LKLFEKLYLGSHYLLVLVAIVASAAAIRSLYILRGTLTATKHAAEAAKDQASAAKTQAQAAQQALVLSERPWIKIRHRIVQPLTFHEKAWKGEVASIIIEDTLENVGPSVAVDVSSWEDVIPIDSDYSTRSARARQSQWCDANRHPDPHSLAGYVLFPKDPLIQNSHVGPTMETVLKAAAASPKGLSGKVGFVMVGCVCYRAPFEPKEASRHETRFMYYLGKIEKNGLMMPYVQPSGVGSDLQLVMFPDGFSAD
jgi:hypothetical protein